MPPLLSMTNLYIYLFLPLEYRAIHAERRGFAKDNAIPRTSPESWDYSQKCVTVVINAASYQGTQSSPWLAPMPWFCSRLPLESQTRLLYIELGVMIFASQQLQDNKGYLIKLRALNSFKIKGISLDELGAPFERPKSKHFCGTLM